MELYQVNWKVQLWLCWRKSNGKRPLKVSNDGYFLVLTESEFDDYCKFEESHKFLTPLADKMCTFLKENELLHYRRETGVEYDSKSMYGMQFVLLTDAQLVSLAQWIQSRQLM